MVAMRYTRPGQDVKDTEEYSIGCLALLDAAESFDDDVSMFSTWAIRKIRNAIIVHWRQQTRKKKEPKNILSIERHLSESQLDKLVRHDHSDLEELFPLVPEMLEPNKQDTPTMKRDKRILVLHFIKGMSYAQIGRKLSITREGIRVAVKRGLEEIRNRYWDQLKDWMDD
jgi:RNA polymerase sigma factor (sigma-70 family)